MSEQKNINKIQNLLTNCLDCAGIEPGQTFAPPFIKRDALNSYLVDLTVEDYDEEQLAYFVGFLAQTIGMKNVWFDTYPSSGRVCFELVFPIEELQH